MIMALLTFAAMVVVAGWYLRRRARDEPRPLRGRPAYLQAPPRRARQHRRYDALTIEELCAAWAQSCADLRKAPPGQRLRYVEERQSYLDELERRDPDGLRAWLATSASAAGNPRRFITRHP